jgi:hypothetical protein
MGKAIHNGVGMVEYKCYRGLLDRCHTATNKNYPSYGGRGITVCDRWRFGENGKAGFECFLDDIGEKPVGDYCIDRIDNDKGYSKENCRWATRELSMNNQRQRKNKFGLPGVIANGKRYTAQIRDMGKVFCLGTFDTPAQASEAYQKARAKKLIRMESVS